MNEVYISGIIKGDFVEVSNDGVMFTILNRAQRDGQDNDEFTALAYGNSAKFLTQHAESGMRIVAQGRISSEKLGTENYHHAITVSRVLGICDSSQGIDYTHAIISGKARADEVRTTGRGTSVLGLNVANERVYKRDDEEQVYTTYLGATLWGDNADSFAQAHGLPLDNAEVVFDGILKPRSYEKDGNTIGKIDVWINNITVSGAAADAPAPKKDTTAPGKRQKKLTDAPF